MEIKNKLSDITIDRIRDNSLENAIPEFYKLKNVIENNNWHSNQNVFDHTLKVVENLEYVLNLSFVNNAKSKELINNKLNSKVGNYTQKELLLFAALLHDIAKTETLQVNEDKTTACPEHEIKSSLKVEEIASRFDLNENDILFVKEIIEKHNMPHITLDINKNRTILLKEFEEIKNNHSKVYLELILLAMADTLGSDLKQNLPEEYDFRVKFYEDILNNYI